MKLTPETLRDLADGLANQNHEAERQADLMARADVLLQAVRRLMPAQPDTDPSDGPCCYEFVEDSGYWLPIGCTCGNYDDAQDASDWASDMNRWISAEKTLRELGVSDLVSEQ